MMDFYLWIYDTKYFTIYALFVQVSLNQMDVILTLLLPLTVFCLFVCFSVMLRGWCPPSSRCSLNGRQVQNWSPWSVLHYLWLWGIWSTFLPPGIAVFTASHCFWLCFLYATYAYRVKVSQSQAKARKLLFLDNNTFQNKIKDWYHPSIKYSRHSSFYR